MVLRFGRFKMIVVGLLRKNEELKNINNDFWFTKFRNNHDARDYSSKVKWNLCSQNKIFKFNTVVVFWDI